MEIKHHLISKVEHNVHQNDSQTNLPLSNASVTFLQYPLATSINIPKKIAQPATEIETKNYPHIIFSGINKTSRIALAWILDNLLSDTTVKQHNNHNTTSLKRSPNRDKTHSNHHMRICTIKFNIRIGYNTIPVQTALETHKSPQLGTKEM